MITYKVLLKQTYFRKEFVMKKIGSFFGKMLSDCGNHGRPGIDPQGIMYSYIIFSGAPRKINKNHKNPPDNIINFNDFKLRRA